MEHFVGLEELTGAQIWDILNRAKRLKEEWAAGGNEPILKGKVLGMVFQKPSLRTRVSFDVAMLHLGGHALYLSPQEIGLGKRESVADVARVLSRYVDAIMARVFSHEHILELARYSRVPVINGLSDYNHPCQAIGDMLTVWEHKGETREMRGLKFAYIGDGNNVATSLLFATTRLGMHFSIASPAGYDLPSGVMDRGAIFAKEGGSKVMATREPKDAVRDADVIYTDVWTSMGQEAEQAERLVALSPYQVNAELVSYAKDDVIVMHCLPAHRGEEITDEVADGPHSVLFDQAENRLHGQKGILATLMA